MRAFEVAALATPVLDADLGSAESMSSDGARQRGLARTAHRVVVLALLGVWTLVLAPLQALLNGLGLSAARNLPVVFFRGCAKLLRLRVHVDGTPIEGHPVLFVANHASFLDIVALGSMLPVAFLSRADVDSWPGIGLIARLGRTEYTGRSRSGLADEAARVRARLRAGDSLVLFPEATTGDGEHLLPFKSAFFAAVEGADDITVQPVALDYALSGGRRLDGAGRVRFAWGRTQSLAEHFDAILAQPPLTIVVRLLPALRADPAGGRKDLAAQSRQNIEAALLAARGCPAASG